MCEIGHSAERIYDDDKTTPARWIRAGSFPLINRLFTVQKSCRI